ncbi:hypothetical protein [Polaribacter sp. M15]|jgi:hypothetical protein
MSYIIGVNRTGIDTNNYKYSRNSVIVHYLGDETPDLPNYKLELLKLL